MRKEIFRPALAKGLYRIIGTVAISCIAFICDAQICQGSLGDPIVNITFGAGPNPGPPVTAASTNYTYVNTDCPKDGNYAVRNKTENCFDNLWFPVTDHTGDPDGYFMLVNASHAPGEFYLDTVRGLCSGSTYEFASWLINVSRPVLCWGATQIIVPNITFRIETITGSVLQTYNTGDIPASDPPQWKQYGFFFTTPAGITDVVLRMVNNAPGGCGNDVGLDDITFRPCGPQVTSTISGSNKTLDTLCGGTAKTYILEGNSSPGYNNPVYQWQESYNNSSWTDIPGANTTTHQVNFTPTEPAGIYSYRLVASEFGNIGSTKCRVASSQVNIHVTPRVEIAASANSPVCEGSEIRLTSSGSSVHWTGPNGYNASGSSVSISPAQTSHAGDYIATTTSNGCSWTDTVSVVVAPKPVLVVTPDTATICAGDSIPLAASGATNYIWLPISGLSDPSQPNVTAAPSATSSYSVIGMDSRGCSDTAVVNIKVLQRPVANAGGDLAVLKGTAIQLNGSATGEDLSYYWTPAYNMTGVETLRPTVTPEKDTSYVLNVISNAGCGSDSDTMRVIIFKQVQIPNAFSPNGDMINDRWNIAGLNSYPQAVLTVFDRYGREVLRSRSYEPWDGTRNGQPVGVGVYYYVIDLRNGSPRITGSVYLAR